MLRGVLIVYVETDDDGDKVECLWVKIRGKVNRADIVMGVCYRPPNQDKQPAETPYKLVAEVSQSTALVFMGNFNLLDVCWKYNTAERKQRFLECVKDNFLTQRVNEPTRRAALPDLLFVNIEGLMGGVKAHWKAVLKKRGPRKSGHI